MPLPNEGGEDEDKQIVEEEIMPESKPPEVPQEGTYIDALNEAGINPERIEQLQQSKFNDLTLLDVEEQ